MGKNDAALGSQSPELKALLEHQEAIAVALKNIDGLESTIAGCEKKRQDIVATIPPATALQSQLESLHAGAALGQVTDDELAKRVAAIEKQERDRAGTASGIQAYADRVQFAINGLNVQLREAQGKLSRLRSESSQLVRNFLKDETEKICASYVDAGATLKACFIRILAMNILFHHRAGGPDLLPGHWPGLIVPLFNLPQCEPFVHPNHHGVLINEEIAVGAQAAAVESESARFRGLGVTILDPD